MLKHMSKYSWIKEEITTEISKCYAFVRVVQRNHIQGRSTGGEDQTVNGGGSGLGLKAENQECGGQETHGPRSRPVHLPLPCGPIRSSLDWMSGSYPVSGRWIFFSAPHSHADLFTDVNVRLHFSLPRGVLGSPRVRALLGPSLAEDTVLNKGMLTMYLALLFDLWGDTWSYLWGQHSRSFFLFVNIYLTPDMFQTPGHWQIMSLS